MNAQGFAVHASEGNVADWESTRAAFEKVRNELGPVDILVNNAESPPTAPSGA
jgi:acetoacetyl-CoA reductase